MASSASGTFPYSYPSYVDVLNQRQQIFQHFELFAQLNSKVDGELVDDSTAETLKLHGVSDDEINDINEINNCVKLGRQKITDLLQEHAECIHTMYEMEQKIKALNENINLQKLCITTLAGLHERFASFKEQFTEFDNLKTSVMEDMEAELASHVLNKERIETLLSSLGTTYNILRSTPLVHICPICITNEIDTYLEPCGHTLCRNCNRDQFCHMCRTQIRSSRKLYYS